MFLNVSRDGDPTTPMCSLCQYLDNLSVKKYFLISNPNLLVPSRDLLVSSCGLLLETRQQPQPGYYLLSCLCREWKVPRGPLLQTKQSLFPNSLLIWFVFQTLHQLYCPSFDMLNGNLQHGHELSQREARASSWKLPMSPSKPREKLEELQVMYCENCGMISTAELRDFVSILALAFECF